MLGTNDVTPSDGLPSAPDAPTDLTSTAVAEHDIALSWTAPVNVGGTPIQDYFIEYSLHQSDPANDSWISFGHASAPTTTVDVTGLSGGQSYDFRVSAINGIGTGSASSIYTVSTTAPTATEGDIKITVKSITGDAIVGATVNVACPGWETYSALGVTDSKGVVEANPHTLNPDCNDGAPVNVQISQSGYVDFTNQLVGTYHSAADPEDGANLAANIFAVSLVPSFTGAGSGTQMDPYIVSDCVQLDAISSNLSASYKIIPTSGNTIDCAGINFQPIGMNVEGGFTGTLDGNNVTVENLVINQPVIANVGLFSSVYEATIKNLTLSAGTVTGEYQVGSFVGMVSGGVTLQNLSSDLAVSAVDDYDEAGIVGYANINDGASSVFSNLTYTGTVDTPEGNLGGIIGQLNVSNPDTLVTIDHATVTGGFIGVSKGGDSVDVGGIVGEALVDVESDGGQAGLIISNATVSSTISTTSNSYQVGGLIGQLQADSEYGNGVVNLIGNNVTSNVSGGSSIGGFIGAAGVYDYNGGMTLLIDQDTSSGTITSTYSNVSGGIGYANLYIQSDSVNQIKITNSSVSGTVTGDGFVGGFIGGTQGEGPGITVNSSSGQGSGGLVMQNDNSSASIIGNVSDDNAYYTGGLAGYLWCYSNNSANPAGCSIASSYATGSVSSYGAVGGLVGGAQGDVSIVDAYATGDVTGDTNVGGLIGYASWDGGESMTIDRTYAASRVTSTGDSISDIGGWIGYVNANGGPVTIADSFAVPNMQNTDGNSSVGWMIGAMDSGNPQNLWYAPDPATGSNPAQCISGTSTDQCTSQTSNYFVNSTSNHPLDAWDFTHVWIEHANANPTLTGTVYVPNVPVVRIISPASGSVISTWTAPVIDWGNSTSCSYYYGTDDGTSVKCSNNGSDIPAPTTTGDTTLNVQGQNDGGKGNLATIALTFRPDISGEVGKYSAYYKLDETVPGSTVIDSSINHNDGTLSGTPVPSSDHPNLANIADTESLLFNPETHDSVNVLDSSTINATGSFSVAFWMKPQAWADGTSQGIISKFDPDSGLGFIIYDDGSSNCKNGDCSSLLNLRIAGSKKEYDYLPTQSQVEVGSWHHYAVVYDADAQTLTWYKDGTVDKQNKGISAGDMTNTTQATIGYSQPWSGTFDGNLDDVRFYQSVLSPADVVYLAQTISSTEILTQVTPIASQTTAANAIYTFSVSDSIDTALQKHEGSYQFTEVSGIVGNHSVEVHLNPTTHQVTFTGLLPGDHPSTSFNFVHGNTITNTLQIGPFTVVGASSGGGGSNTSGGSVGYSNQGYVYLAGVPAGSQVPVVGLFLNNLKPGIKSPDVIRLQKFLNANGFVITKTGAGSPGHETNSFGPATKSALKKFQKSHGLTPDGSFGPKTRAIINAIINQTKKN